jgi:hypothetical protein
VAFRSGHYISDMQRTSSKYVPADMMAQSGLVLVAILMVVVLAACEAFEDPPENHSIDFNGVWHMPGYEDPGTNCTPCHGDNLEGGSSGVGCYECHDKLP